MYGTPPCIPGLVQTNITNSAEEKWALLDKDIEMEDSETENENRNGRTILHHTISLHRSSEARPPPPPNHLGLDFQYIYVRTYVRTFLIRACAC